MKGESTMFKDKIDTQPPFGSIGDSISMDDYRTTTGPITGSTVTPINQEYCGYRLPCGICRMTMTQCPRQTMQITWTSDFSDGDNESGSMSILIKGMKMPTDHPLWIVVHSDGTVEANEVSQSRPVGWQTLRNATVPVPPHGRLIDADELMKQVEHDAPLSTVYEKTMRRYLNNAPTIIPADGEEGT